MTIFISGGCKNGKSTLAEELAVGLSAGADLYYVATMLPRDGEDRQRVARHRAARAGRGFVTLEQPRQLLSALAGREDGVFLLDSVTALLENEMFPPEGPDGDAGARTAAALADFARGARHAVFVSDSIGADAGAYGDWTRRYRQALARCERTLARCCDTVVEVCAGCPVVYKGALSL